MTVRVGSFGGLELSRRKKNGYNAFAPTRVAPSRPRFSPRGKGNRNRSSGGGRQVGLGLGQGAHFLGRAMTRLASMAFAAVFVLALSVGLLAGYRWLTTVRYFSLEDVEITGLSRLAEDRVRTVAGIEPGSNLLALSMERVRSEIGRDPWVESVAVTRVLPGTLKIQVVEKVPSFLVQYRETLYYADGSGRIIDKVEPGSFVSLPQIEIEAGMERKTELLARLRENASGHAALFDLSKVAWIRLSWGRGVEIKLLDSGVLFCIGSGDWERNLSRLGMVWADLRKRGETEQIALITAEGDKVWVEKRS